MGVVTPLIPRQPLTAADRARIATQIETLIALLDADDGDPDLEPEQDMDAAADDGCGPIFVHGRRCWGSENDEPYRGVAAPRYGADQRRGPINAFSATGYAAASWEGC